jgi:hypothetical protein
MNLFNAMTGFQADLGLESIIQTTENVMGDAVANNLCNLQIDGYDHSFCYDTLSVVQQLESVLQGIKPLYLTAFSRKPAVSDTRHEWESFLDAERTHIRLHPCTSTEVCRLDVCMYGDMEIILKTNTMDVIYAVSSHQLRAGSPTFRNLLGQDSPFQEHARHSYEPTHDSVLNADDPNQMTRYQHEVNEDFDPTAFCIVLYLLHAEPSGRYILRKPYQHSFHLQPVRMFGSVATLAPTMG